MSNLCCGIGRRFVSVQNPSQVGQRPVFQVIPFSEPATEQMAFALGPARERSVRVEMRLML